MRIKAIFLILLNFPTCLHALDHNPMTFSSTIQEKRYRAIIAELRCVQCQNQSVADSEAPIAQDIRNLVGNKIIEGYTNQQITNFLVERYGDFILYNPPFKSITYFLWLLPFILLLLALGILRQIIRRHAITTAMAPAITDEERQKIKQALGE